MYQGQTAELIYDGRCGFCTRTILFLQRLDVSGRLLCTPWQAPGTLERTRLLEHQVKQAAWLISDGQRVSGALAIAAALDVVLQTLWIQRAVQFLPVRWAANGAYGLIARHRYLFRGVTPTCQRQPSTCGGH